MTTKREFSAGGIVFRKEKKGFLWLLIKPNGHLEWRFPKGKINKSESSVAAAKREVKEEAGIEVKILEKIGEIKFFFTEDKQKIFKTVIFYLMEYVKESEDGFESETEAIEWLSFNKAEKRLAFDKEQKLLREAEVLRQKIAKDSKGGFV
ncbi:MAG: NUDIX domain-containing protein [Candidatus Shapirobacteria bacterium]|nr:NUDIX domain-containing protein [Candidatus Shapirobacteria bacterium]